MRLATFNILHGRSPTDGLVDLGRLADAVRALDPDILALQEVDRLQTRSQLADLTAVAAEAMDAVSHRFAAALSGTPGATWIAATGSELPDTAAFGVALLSRYPGDGLAGAPAAADPGDVPAVPARRPQGDHGARGAAVGGDRPARTPRPVRWWSPTRTCRSCPAGDAGS